MRPSLSHSAAAGPSRPLHLLPLALLVAAPLSAGGAIQPAQGPSPLALAPTANGVAVVEGEDRRGLRLPATVEPTAFETLAGDRWLLAGIDRDGDRDRLYLLSDRTGTVALHRAPRTAGHRLAEAAPWIAGGELAGVAWLEGPTERSLAVRAAVAHGDAWSEPVSVSPSGAGSQLALDAVPLAGGGALLVWSAFDGTDDEILWSRGGEAGWSLPRRLAADDAVPDVTPALGLVGDRPAVAWSRFVDGEYELFLARWVDGGWTEPVAVAGAGSILPSWSLPGAWGEAWLLHRDAAADGWGLIEIGKSGLPLSRAAVAAAPIARPVVEATAGDAVRWRWPADGVERESRLVPVTR